MPRLVIMFSARAHVLAGRHSLFAYSVNQIVMSPRLRNAALYSGKLVTLNLGWVNFWRRFSFLCKPGCPQRVLKNGLARVGLHLHADLGERCARSPI